MKPLISLPDAAGASPVRFTFFRFWERVWPLTHQRGAVWPCGVCSLSRLHNVSVIIGGIDQTVMREADAFNDFSNEGRDLQKRDLSRRQNRRLSRVHGLDHQPDAGVEIVDIVPALARPVFL